MASTAIMATQISDQFFRFGTLPGWPGLSYGFSVIRWLSLSAQKNFDCLTA